MVAKRPAVQTLEPKRTECVFTRSEDGLLFDCRGCPQGKDLNDVVCLKRVISVLADQTEVNEVVLSGDWESLYREGCVRVLNAYAELVRACRCGSLAVQGGEQCQSCPNDPRKLVAAIADRAPLPWDDLRRRASSAAVRPGCYACAASAASLMTRLEAISKGIDRIVAKEAFRIVGVSE
ncbi:MAG TPA: hypothetical protein VGK23_09710 [Methanomassiliicoccales archaeon]